MRLFRCITGLVSENHLAVNALTSPKNSSNPQKSTLTYFSINMSQIELGKLFLIWSEISRLLVNTLTASYEYSHSNKANLRLPIQFKLSKKPSVYSGIFFLNFGIYINFPMFWKKHEPHRSNFSEVIYSERRVYLNGLQGLFPETLWQWTC